MDLRRTKKKIEEDNKGMRRREEGPLRTPNPNNRNPARLHSSWEMQGALFPSSLSLSLYNKLSYKEIVKTYQPSLPSLLYTFFFF